MNRLSVPVARWQGLVGWRRYGAAVLLGGMLAAAQAPLYLWPLGLAALVAMQLLVVSGSRRQAFLTLYLFAYGYFVAGLYWIGIAFFVDAERFAILLPLPVLGLPLLLALFPAGAAWLGDLAGGRNPVWRHLLLPCGWLLGEWLRGWVLTGFPWNLVGYVWGMAPFAMQPAAWIGAHGLGLVTMLACSGLALAAAPQSNRHLRLAALALPLGFGLLLAAGAWRVAVAPFESVSGVQFRLVQPSVPQTLKWRDDLRQKHLEAHIALTLQPAAVPPTHIVWPETAIPYLLDEETALRAALSRLAPSGGALITGAPRRSFDQTRSLVLYNSIFALGPDGALAAQYDKIHLVPFGEYLPLRALLRPLGLDALAVGSIDFSPGAAAAAMAIPGLPPARALVCYEAIFPAEIAAAGPPARWLLNITNDAWFGRSSGPHQHLAAARFRAVEQGLPLVRAANNGISAIVDPYGRMIASLGLDAVGVVDGPLPRPLDAAPLYARLGDGPLVGLALALLLLGWLVNRRRINH
ncbi:apolipoprotein N-acyltransferase [Ferrovibrio sp.]|jgi:apolipoprotein N-acyltransferase|uniref:apolipoprotein N-acyltransferase n=1 Tax=Ferrovibrio sp. TaxID=1917215 RepID=UPI00391A006C